MYKTPAAWCGDNSWNKQETDQKKHETKIWGTTYSQQALKNSNIFLEIKKAHAGLCVYPGTTQETPNLSFLDELEALHKPEVILFYFVF